jgi:hypothetical protein
MMYDDRTLLGRAAHRHTAYRTTHLGREGVRISDSRCFLGSFPSGHGIVKKTTYEIRVNANLPDDDLQAGCRGRALRTR